MTTMNSQKKTLVIGASTNPERYAYKAIERLTQYGHSVVAVGIKSGEVFGVPIETSLLPFTDIHTITLYLNPERQKEYYSYILSLQPKRVIFNPGTENPELMELLEQNHIDYEIACTLVLLGTGQF